jgi:hypothetical protein
MARQYTRTVWQIVLAQAHALGVPLHAASEDAPWKQGVECATNMGPARPLGLGIRASKLKPRAAKIGGCSRRCAPSH